MPVCSSAWKTRRFTPDVQRWISSTGQLTAAFLQSAWEINEQAKGLPTTEIQVMERVAELYNAAMMAVVMQTPAPTYMKFDRSMRAMEQGFAAQLHRQLPALSCRQCALLTELCHQQREQLQFMNLQNRLSETQAAWSQAGR
jgi:hypothetical protein